MNKYIYIYIYIYIEYTLEWPSFMAFRHVHGHAYDHEPPWPDLIIATISGCGCADSIDGFGLLD